MLKAMQNLYPHASKIYIERKRITYPRIVIKADTSLFIRVPLHFSNSQIQDFITQYHTWIESTLQKSSASYMALQATLNAHPNEILLFGSWQDISHFSNPLKPQLLSMLQDYIYPRVNEYATLMGLTYQSIKITNALSRFGSCTHDNRLFFSFMLIFAKKHFIDYVIIHELAHICYKNHSHEFWNLVIKYCPNAKALRLALRQEARLYPALLQRINQCKE
ncbi:M48 family peptidase [Helicobacter marmotae]|uniref:M48 family peptidase n=3 Tax=Helicobacter marmotae TaxID=152490 RepID=A0A3D8I7R5_9HELI|nr:M48 family peptidase [Helicobacter marmotae]